MGREEFCKEVERVLKELGPEGKTSLKKLLEKENKSNEWNSYRYHYKKGEETYERVLKFRKVKNLIEYLLKLDEDNREE
mgnify:CR=1 FL=1